MMFASVFQAAKSKAKIVCHTCGSDKDHLYLMVFELLATDLSGNAHIYFKDFCFQR